MSPASVRSIHPTETSSPATKAPKPNVPDEVKVEELVEGDPGYMTDVDVVHPYELEEAVSESEENSDNPDDTESDSDVTRLLSKLDCEDSAEAEFEKKRRAKHARRRTNSRVFKRSHSQSMRGDMEATDSDAMADQDLSTSKRRLRRRVRGPRGMEVVSKNTLESSPELGGLAPPPELFERRNVVNENEIGTRDEASGDAMDIDHSE